MPDATPPRILRSAGRSARLNGADMAQASHAHPQATSDFGVLSGAVEGRPRWQRGAGHSTIDAMTDTPDPNETKPDAPSDGFASENLRAISDVHRSSDDRIVAGVCAGVARHLNVDPIIVRIAVVALTFVGLSGLILYLAAWFLLPEDDADRSVAADWFRLDQNEPQVLSLIHI